MLLKKLIVVVTVIISKLFKLLKGVVGNCDVFRALFRLGSSQMSRQVASISVALTQLIVQWLSVFRTIHTQCACLFSKREVCFSNSHFF